jgi:integrase
VRAQGAFGILGALTGWALIEVELTGANPFKRLGIVKPIGQRDAGLSFTYGEARKLLSKTHRLNDEHRDIIRLLACTGARLAEISGLEVQDVDLQEMTINIRFNATRRLKNNQSVRTVPVVDERSIEALRIRIAGKRLTDVVFPRYWREGGPDSASAALSKWLTRIGLRDTRARIPKTTTASDMHSKTGSVTLEFIET